MSYQHISNNFSTMPDIDQTERRSRNTTLMIVLGFVIVAPIFALVMFGMGQISGVEFSPDDFSSRTFSYNQIPLVGWVVAQKSFVDQTPTLEQLLISNKLIKPVVNKKKVWHLVSESGVRTPSTECDARFLMGYLRKQDESGNYFWDTWNTEKPNSAKIFWPYVAQLARDEMYLKISDVMRAGIAVTKDKPIELDNELKQIVAKAYFQLGSLDFENGNAERSKYRLGRSIEYAPSREAYSVRAKVNKELGFNSESQKDSDDAKTAESIDAESINAESNDAESTDGAAGDQ